MAPLGPLKGPPLIEKKINTNIYTDLDQNIIRSDVSLKQID